MWRPRRRRCRRPPRGAWPRSPSSARAREGTPLLARTFGVACLRGLGLRPAIRRAGGRSRRRRFAPGPEDPLRLVQRSRCRIAVRERRERAFEAKRLAVTVGIEVVRLRPLLRGCRRRESRERDEAQIPDNSRHWARGGKSFGVTALLASVRSSAVSVPALTTTRCSQSLTPPLRPTTRYAPAGRSAMA